MQFGDKNHKVGRILTRQDAKHAENLKDTGHWGKKGAGCIFLARDTGRICLNKRSKEILEPNTWGTWGGAIDEKEDPKEAVKREAKEETGKILSMDLIPLYVFKKPDFEYHNFLAIVDKEFKPKLDWESSGYIWCDYDDLPSPMHPGLKKLFDDRNSWNIIMSEVDKIAKKNLKEDAPAVSAGAGAVAGLGVGPQGEPGMPKSVLIRRTKFMNHEVFEVDSNTYHKARLGKAKHHRYARYVGEDEVGQEIRKYGRENPGKPIILKHERTGALQFLKYGKYQ